MSPADVLLVRLTAWALSTTIGGSGMAVLFLCMEFSDYRIGPNASFMLLLATAIHFATRRIC